MPTVHTYSTTSEAYDDSQCNDAVKDGDILWVPNLGTAAILVEAWPAMCYGNDPGVFHTLEVNWETLKDGKYMESVRFFADWLLAAKTAVTPFDPTGLLAFILDTMNYADKIARQGSGPDFFAVWADYSDFVIDYDNSYEQRGDIESWSYRWSMDNA